MFNIVIFYDLIVEVSESTFMNIIASVQNSNIYNRGKDNQAAYNGKPLLFFSIIVDHCSGLINSLQR